ncbi:MAG: hypothetical protein OMM_04722 [Candidatus Magnetoglobus multicellularis str. Araruama]|uniref:Multi-sensor hybrid histidine kinase n=1 Tax=Candidatus Magnetoglobus multicellularis str. Araruama TaxID=890399 RepID=A0A1V1P043_9BACT|nr:MAG: hypothetical protein OMM_04722 [Candidatus Magnetoglobus multicellularis str. Araruama]
MVEDHLVNQKVILGMLNKFGFHADTVNDGEAALEILKTKAYDMIFMDIQMPKMNGYETTKAIRNPNTPVLKHDTVIIALTANAMKTDRDKCMACGMDDYLSKPFNSKDIQDIINKHIKDSDQNSLASTNDFSLEGHEKHAPYDHNLLLERMDNDEQLCKDLVVSFITDFEERFKKLKEAWYKTDCTQLGMLAHSIKGAASLIEACQIKEIALSIENAAKEDEKQLIDQLIKNIEKAFAIFKEAALPD